MLLKVRSAGFHGLGLLRKIRPPPKAYAVLAYHQIIDGYNPQYLVGNECVEVALFKRQMGYITEHCCPIGLAELYQRLKAGIMPDKFYVAVTFDDGYRSCLEFALPILQSLNIPATFFLTVNFIEQKTTSLPRLYMDWQDAEYLVCQDGMLIGAHGVSHQRYAQIKFPLRDDILPSKTILEEKLGRKILFYAYPFGTKSEVTQSACNDVKSVGFTAAFTALDGFNVPADNPFMLKRIVVPGRENFEMFRTRLYMADCIARIKN